jgi:hypothetical protein
MDFDSFVFVQCTMASGTFGTMLGQCWDNVGTMLGQCWDNVGTMLGQCWDLLGQFWDILSCVSLNTCVSLARQ